MATPKDYSRTTLSDFPGYDAYLIVNAHGDYGLGSLYHDQILFKYYCRYGRFRWLNDCHDLIKKSSLPNIICGTSEVSDSDTFIMHPDCIIPRSLVSVGKVLNEKSPEIPTKLVIPYNYINSIYYETVSLMVNPIAKIVFIIVTKVSEDDARGSEAEWLNGIVHSSDLCNTFSQTDLCDFTMPYGKSVFLLSNLSDFDSALLQGCIPPDKVVCETKLTTGNDPLTVDVLYSCYKMLSSSDPQIVESACNMLARNRFDNVDALVGWILRTYKKKIGYYRSKSTAFKWLWGMCLDKYRIPAEMKPAGKELVIKITNNEVHWDGTTMVVTNASRFDDSSLRALVDLINKS